MPSSAHVRFSPADSHGGAKLESSHPSSRTASAESLQLPVVGALLVATLLLRLPFLSGTSLWLDEIWSIATARLPWHQLFWVILHQDSNAGLYYVVLHLWLRLGSSEASVRTLSVLLAAATVPVLYQLGNRLLGKPVGLVACLLLAVNKLHVSQSQDARTYSLLVLLVTVSSLCFVRCVERPSAKNWLAWVLVSVLAVYAHVFAVLALAAQGVSLLFLRRREAPWKAALTSAGVVLALVAPLGYLLKQRTGAPGAPLGWVPHLSVGSLARIVWSLAGSSHYDIWWALAPSIALSLAYVGFCAVSLAWCIRLWRERGPSLETWRAGFVLSGLLVPLLITMVVSLKAPVLVDKYLIVCMPAMVIAAAKGMQLMGRKRSAVATASVVALAAIALLPYYTMRARDREWQGVTATIGSQARPGDAIVFMVAPGRLLYLYYGGEKQGRGPDVLYPQFKNEFMKDPSSLEYLPPLNPELLERVAPQYSRIWVVLYHNEFADTRPVSQRIESALSERYRKVEDQVFDGTPFFERAEVQLYANDRVDSTNLSRTAGAGVPASAEFGASGSHRSNSGAVAEE